MKRKFFSMMLVAGMVTFGSCVGDDIDSLQDQINELEQEVGDLQAAQQAALEAKVATLMAEIEALQAANEAQDGAVQAEIDALLAQLASLETTVSDNKAEVFYGNLTNADEYAALAAQVGATIVTGNVTVNTTEEAAAIANISMVGGDVNLYVATNLNLATIGGMLSVENLDETTAEISFPNLSIAGGVSILSNTGLKSIVADELRYIGGVELSASTMELLSFAKLLQVSGDIDWNGYDGDNWEIGEVGGPSMVNFNGADVTGDVNFSYAHGDNLTLSLGNVGGSLNVSWSRRIDIEVIGTSIGGKLKVTNNVSPSFSGPNLETVGVGYGVNTNVIEFTHNYSLSFDQYTYEKTYADGIRTLNFDKLKVMNSSIKLQYNRYDMTDISLFNAIESMNGMFTFKDTYNEFIEVNMLNAATKVGYGYVSFETVTTNVSAFESLTQGNINMWTDTSVLNDYCGMKTFLDNLLMGVYTGNLVVYDGGVQLDNFGLGGWVGTVTANCSDGGGIGISGF